MNLLLIGVNHRTATLDDREALAFGPSEAFTVLCSLIDGGAVSEAALLSTCNRTEFYVVAADADAGEHAVRDVVVRARHRDLLTPGSNRYEFRDHAAAAHLFRVACSLDSLVLGDVQILGQVKNAYQIARRGGATGWLLDRLFETALHAGKRSRAETGIGTGSVSVPSAAVALAADVCGRLEGQHVLIVGAGETARLAATAAQRHRPASMVIVNRTEPRAVSLCAAVGARARPFDRLADALADADVVFSATRAQGAVISVDAVAHAMTWRRERRLLLFDLAVPRDIDPGRQPHPRGRVAWHREHQECGRRAPLEPDRSVAVGRADRCRGDRAVCSMGAHSCCDANRRCLARSFRAYSRRGAGATACTRTRSRAVACREAHTRTGESPASRADAASQGCGRVL